MKKKKKHTFGNVSGNKFTREPYHEKVIWIAQDYLIVSTCSLENKTSTLQFIKFVK